MKNMTLCIMMTLTLSGCTSTFEGENRLNSSSEEFSTTRLYEQAQVAKFYPKKRSSKKISGICFLTDEGDAQFDRPCMNFSVSLIDGRNEVVLRKTTDEQGRFQFLVSDTRIYQLRVESNKYKMSAPKIMLSAGAEVLVRMVRK